MTEKTFAWGILAPGGIAKQFAGGVAHSQHGRIAAIATRDPKKPDLAESFPGARILDGYQALLDDKEVEAIYVATPHPMHAQWGIKAARAGKATLIEKPLALTAFEADAMFHEARKAKVFMGEAFMYRAHPQTAKLIEIIRSGRIGEVRTIKSSFGFAMPAFDPKHRLYANDLAGGGILDVGCYPVSMARLVAGAAVGKDFLDPVTVSGVAHLGEQGGDEWASAVMKFDGGILAEVSCSVSLQQDNMLRILGTKGRIEVADFWFASGKTGGVGKIEIIMRDGARESVDVHEPGWLYSFEADRAVEAIRAGAVEFSAPCMSQADSLGNLRALDKWRAGVGLEYEIEKAPRRSLTLAGTKLGANEGAIAKRAIPGLSKPTSIIALGFEDFRTFSSGSILLDAFWERGGNLFDTGYVYGLGYTDILLGQWLKSRGVREEAVITGKGAHSPLCRPEFVGQQLKVSLDRLQTDHVDVYFMHRDNPDVPVGEFVDAMDSEAKAGRIRGIFGGSNWTMARMKEAIAYAKRTGKQAPQALSNNFALAKMIKAIWAGCISASDDDTKAWLMEAGIANFSWSSQGRGFFTDRAGRDKLANAELVDTWYSEENFARRDRAVELAKRMGRQPIHIALAYVLAQKFPSIPLIGPRTLAELDDSVSALDIKLSERDVHWLETGGA